MCYLFLSVYQELLRLVLSQFSQYLLRIGETGKKGQVRRSLLCGGLFFPFSFDSIQQTHGLGFDINPQITMSYL